MTHTAGWPLGGTPGASGGADNDVVDVGSALHPAAVHVPSFVVSLCAPAQGRVAQTLSGSGEHEESQR